MTHIKRLLVANRGEIARRVFRTCRDAGITTVAVFSDADAGSPHVAEADLAVRLPGRTSAQTYLNAGAIIAAALASDADAVHPGYGFLSEDPKFAQQVLDAGLLWIGPPPAAMSAMALKIQARERSVDAGLPVLSELDPGSVTEFPVLVKASAGGGGRGMRAVHSAAELDDAIESAKREAQAAFGDGTVFCEPLLAGARHIEVQVLADSHGTVWALTERDCSTQRRYAKVIEETPAPAVGPALRARLLEAAATLAKAVGYVNAGTVEFLVAGAGSNLAGSNRPDSSRAEEFYFLEFNTRLQVEHPVTELVHDIDLVAWQLAIAEGQPLPAEPPPAVGHAMQARLYAEDPAQGYRPSAGRVHAFTVPGTDCEFRRPTGLGHGPVLRLDAGVTPGSEVSPHYDAMLAKVITWAPDRPAAARRLATALAAATIAGPATNRDLLVSVLRHPEFLGGRRRHLAARRLRLRRPRPRRAHLPDRRRRSGRRHRGGEPAGRPDRGRCPWRLAERAEPAAADVVHRPARPDRRRLPMDPLRHRRRGRHRRHALGPVIPLGGDADDAPSATVISAEADQVHLDLAGVRHRCTVIRAGNDVWVSSTAGSVQLTLHDRLPAPERAAESGSLVAPMPGSVTKVVAQRRRDGDRRAGRAGT